MTLSDALRGVRRLFLDTAPVIYFAEQKPGYARLVEPVFRRLDEGSLTVVTSPVTLAECLVAPFRQSQADYQQVFIDLLANGPNSVFVALIKNRQSRLRAFGRATTSL